MRNNIIYSIDPNLMGDPQIPNTKPDDFDKFRKEFPETMFIVIFQSTTNGTARDGCAPEYDAGIVILPKVVELIVRKIGIVVRV